MLHSIYYIFLIGMLYIYLHNPLFTILGGMGSIKLLYPLVFLLFLEKRIVKHFFSRYKRILFPLLLILLYTFFRTVFGGDAVHIYTTVVSMIEIFLVPYCLAHFFLLKKRKKVDIFNVIFILGVIASIISITCFLVPSINYLFRYVVQVLDERMIDNESRGFGLSEGLTYSYGMIQGLIVTIWITRMNNYKWFMFFVPFVLFSVIINARTGVVTPIVFIAYYIFRTHNIKILLALVAVSMISFVAFKFVNLDSVNSGTYEWLLSFVDQMLAPLEGRWEDAGTFNTLTGSMFVLPETFSEWIFGRGISLFLEQGMNTDMGFLLQLNYGGICYMVLLFVLLYNVYSLQKRTTDKYIVLAFVIVFLIGNFKGAFILNSGGFRLVMLLTFYFFELNKINTSVAPRQNFRL